MNRRLRQERNAFLVFLAAVFMSLMSALPIVTSAIPGARYVRYPTPAPAPEVTFERFDRNGDGYIDWREAAALERLEAVFNDADRRSDGRLDKVEFGKALSLIDGLK